MWIWGVISILFEKTWPVSLLKLQNRFYINSNESCTIQTAGICYHTEREESKHLYSLYFGAWLPAERWRDRSRAGLCNQSRGVSLSLHTPREHWGNSEGTHPRPPDTNSFLPTESVNTSSSLPPSLCTTITTSLPPSCPLNNISCYQHFTFHSHRIPDTSKGTICTFDARQVSCWDFHFNENYFDFSSFSEKLGVTSYRNYRWYVKLTGELSSGTILWREILKRYETVLI